MTKNQFFAFVSVCAASLFIFSGCSSSSDNKKVTPADGNVSVLEKSIRGEWLSDCFHDQHGNYLQKIKMANGSGTVTSDYMQNQNCSGAVLQTQGPAEFTYVSGESVGETTDVTLTFKDGRAIQSQIKIHDTLMAITIGTGISHYHKINGTVNPAPADNDFDRAAMGSWLTVKCYPGQNNASMKRLLNIAGHGQASLTNLVYATTNCTGDSLEEAAQNFQYTIDNYANGGGQVTINGEPSDVIINGNKLSVNSRTESVDYEKQ